ncbi:alpha/beta fold hydrolase [Streptomyces sp. MNP-20]|uniref:alpha/beta fold hydrolase n=1 Tax=Streptomyces sp. MNP-20 TaxID=2721165 RepID=UPI0015528CC5|nr:alpha/beta fold hydrolase [Streptomyces sp. MNP-20]
MSTAAVRPSFLLVHGSWHRPACWTALRGALAAGGWQCRAVDLPSVGPQPSPTAGMYADADEIAAQLRQMEGPVVVVAHSYGGVPVTQAVVGHPHVVRLVYLTAYMPEEGESLNDIYDEGASTPEEEDLYGSAPVLFDDPRTALYGDLPDDQAEHAVSQLVEQSVRSCQQRVTRAAWRTVPSTYVLCERDQAIAPALQEVMAARATHVERLSSDHSPFLSAPVELAALLGGIASAAVEV